MLDVRDTFPNSKLVEVLQLFNSFLDRKDREKVLKATMLKETAKMLNVDSETLPSVCLYTFLNAHQG